jgi:NADH:ubiquinone oxidoreductase subunit K
LLAENEAVGSRSLAALGGAVFALSFDAYWVWVVERESGPRTAAIAASIAAAAALLIASVVVSSPSTRAGLLTASAVTLSAWAVIASLSVGVLLLPAAALALIALSDARRHAPRGPAQLALAIGAGCALVGVAITLQLASS